MSSRPPSPDAEATLALSHALRTPLTSLALGLGLLDQGVLGPLNAAQRDVIGVLVADVERLSSLVRRELRIEHLGAYAGPLSLVRSDVAAIVEHAEAPLLPQAEERSIALAHELEPGIDVVVDPVKMTWVIASVLGNALRYSPHGGTIAVRLARVSAEAELTITDEGPGMPKDVADRLFDRSVGLGLFLAREIVEAHGGTIDVDSEVSHGSTFTIKLPATD
jgi:signal transduction histidine kinase